MTDPVFWIYEESGKMAAIVNAWQNKAVLSPSDYKTLQWYVNQWIAAFPSKPDDYSKVLTLSPDDLRLYLDDLFLNYGIDPF